MICSNMKSMNTESSHALNIDDIKYSSSIQYQQKDLLFIGSLYGKEVLYITLFSIIYPAYNNNLW